MRKILFPVFFIWILATFPVWETHGKSNAIPSSPELRPILRSEIKAFVDSMNNENFRSPEFSSRLAYFMDAVVCQHPDSIFNVSCLFIDSNSDDKERQRWMLDFLFNRAMESQIPWMENVWVKLADCYYLRPLFGDEDPGWLERLRYTVKLKKYCLIGEKATLFSALTPQGDTLNIANLPGQYIVICFYDPDCTHCKEAIPYLHKLYHKYGRDKLSVIAFNISDDIDLWNSFIEKHGLQDWVNVWDPDRSLSQYDSFYDTPLSPSFYILDAERRIIAKDIEIGEVETFLKSHIIL